MAISWDRKPKKCMNMSQFWQGLQEIRGIFWAGIKFNLGNRILISGETSGRAMKNCIIHFQSYTIYPEQRTNRLKKCFRGESIGYQRETLEIYRTQVERIDLIKIIEHATSDENRRNRPEWMWGKNKTYTVASCYAVITWRGLINKLTKRIWKIKVPTKIKVFMWLTVKNTILI